KEAVLLEIEDHMLLSEISDTLQKELMEHPDMISFMQDIQTTIHQAIESEGTFSKKDAGHLLTLLEQWSTMQKHMGEKSLQNAMNLTLSNDEKQVFEQLLARFQKRNYYSGKGMYPQQSSVTKTDMVKWLQNTIEQYV